MRYPPFAWISACIGGLLCVMVAAAEPGDDPAGVVPAAAPRTQVLAGRAEDFRAYVRTGEGRVEFQKIRADFDARYLERAFPAEPLTYGDPDPKARDIGKAEQWRAAQDTAGLVAGVAEAAAVLWIVTGEERYLAKAREFLLGASSWSLDSTGWETGPVRGATSVAYNDEAHFRLWRKLPLVYDQIRGRLSASERAQVLAHFRIRGAQNLAFVLAGGVAQSWRNSIEGNPESHPIRFMAMTGLGGLALWDDLPEQAREWWGLAYKFYRDRFPSWGGDDGGWSEGLAYWRGTMEHAAFQDGLLAIGDPLAYHTAFWRNTGYFPLYNVQPYRHTGFGDLADAGKFSLEPASAEYLLHLARVLGDGHLSTYAGQARASASSVDLKALNRVYPTPPELLIRNFTASHLSPPAPRLLAELPPSRLFTDIGWVSLHSTLGRPNDDIHVTFKSSPYGSFSHSHADQNAFVLNAYGENLAIASGYREFHNSAHHEGWTRQTVSKNALLIDGLGQKSQDAAATGRITSYAVGPRLVWVGGDATVAYQSSQPVGQVKSVVRDLLFIDSRYVVIRDRVVLVAPGRLTWLLHAERPIEWRAATPAAFIQGAKATLSVRLLAPAGVTWNGHVRAAFDPAVEPSYAKNPEWVQQSHLFAETADVAATHLVFAVLWPEREGRPVRELVARLEADGRLRIVRPDGVVDALDFVANAPVLVSP